MVADFTRAEVAHLVRRSGFASMPGHVDVLVSEPSWAAVVDRVLDGSANPPDTEPPLVVDPDAAAYQATVAAVTYWLDRMVSTPTPIVEKVAFFWHGILTSAVPNPPIASVFRQVATWRRLGRGDLHDLMEAMAIDPAMLDYLDNADNKKASPNENFARELMELFTMGNGTFSEADVVSMARAWTGHNLVYTNQTYVFRPGQHDYGNKTLFGITRAWDGPETITEIIRGSKQQVSARYLAGRIWSFFAYPNPSAALLDELGAALIAADMRVDAFLRVVFNHSEFRAASTRTALVRSPIEWVVAIMTATGLTAGDLGLASALPRMGQVLYRPPNVSGWRSNRAWISSSAMWAKGEVASLVQQRLNTEGTFADLAFMSIPDAVSAALTRFGVDDPAPATRTRLESFLSGERSVGRGAYAPATLAALITLSPDFQLS